MRGLRAVLTDTYCTTLRHTFTPTSNFGTKEAKLSLAHGSEADEVKLRNFSQRQRQNGWHCGAIWDCPNLGVVSGIADGHNEEIVLCSS